MMEQAIEFIKSGRLVIFPTETVFGIGADATNSAACRKIFEIKGRPAINPLIIHVASKASAFAIGEFNEIALLLCKQFWPGPLSIVVPLKEKAGICNVATAGLESVALRMPSNNIASELIRKSGVAIAAPSANPSGYISATNIEHVKEHFTCMQDVYILDTDYKSLYGLESTIIDMTGDNPTILRDGFITREVLSTVLGRQVYLSKSLMQIKAPGMLEKHYSPRVTVRLDATNLQPNEVGLNFGASQLNEDFSLNLSKNADLIEGAANLYHMLRQLDNYALFNKKAQIAVASIPEIGIGVAINDRLTRAASK